MNYFQTYIRMRRIVWTFQPNRMDVSAESTARYELQYLPVLLLTINIHMNYACSSVQTSASVSFMIYNVLQ